jgi:hypothetical protein
VTGAPFRAATAADTSELNKKKQKETKRNKKKQKETKTLTFFIAKIENPWDLAGWYTNALPSNKMQAIFSSADQELFAAANKKLVMEEKQWLLQEWASDALVDAILNSKSPSRVNFAAVPIDQIKAELASGKKTALVWTAKHAIFNKEGCVLGSDCRSELYHGLSLTDPRYWIVRDEHDRRREITVEDAARLSHSHETLQNRRPGFLKAGSPKTSILTVVKHTDFLLLLASRFGDKFTCSYTMEQSGAETQYWTPYVIKVFLQFWPKGVEASNAEKIAKAKADFDKRSETLIVSHCITCKKSLTRANRIESACSKDCRCHEHDGYFCSEECMGPYFRRA